MRHHAAERGVPFDISIDYAWGVFQQQGGRCALTGMELTFGRYRPIGREYTRSNRPRLGSASLDRIDSTMGYSPGNVQWIHKEVNRMKGTLSDDEFVALCLKVVLHNQHASNRPEAGL
jgi:hypothetical protein